MNVKDCMSFEEWSKALAKENEKEAQGWAEIWGEIGAQMKQEEAAALSREVEAARKKAEKEAVEKVLKARGKSGNPALEAAWEKLTKEIWG